jgi:hypothetical protein
MKGKFRNSIRAFLESEAGSVGIKSPLALGITTGGLILAQTIVSTPADAHEQCQRNDQCDGNLECRSVFHGLKILGRGPGQQATVEEIWMNHCVNPG